MPATPKLRTYVAIFATGVRQGAAREVRRTAAGGRRHASARHVPEQI